MAEITKWIVLILVIGAVVLLIKAGMKIINVLIMVFVLGFCWFSFFTEEGCARLSIALNGNPITAYTTELTKDDSVSSSEVTYFKSSKSFKVSGKITNETKCYTKWIVRIPSVGQD